MNDTIRHADNDPDHLFPAFRERLRTVLDAAARASGSRWIIAEGYRSPERQSWLYAQGRTRPGAIVTWMKTPKWHGTGLAADCYPTTDGKTPDFGIGLTTYQVFRHIYTEHGLSNPAWGDGDLGHVQLSDGAVREAALAWVRAGFANAPLAAVKPAVPIYVNGQLVPDAGAYLEMGGVVAALRPITDALDWVVSAVEDGKARLLDETRTAIVPVTIRDGRGFVHLSDLREIGAAVEWDPARKLARVTDTTPSRSG